MKKCNCRSHNGFLTAKGLKEAAQRSAREFFISRGVAVEADQLYLDKVVSVSGLDMTSVYWDDAVIEDQYRRFLNDL